MKEFLNMPKILTVSISKTDYLLAYID